MADHRKHGASREGTYRLNSRRGNLASARFSGELASVSGELGKQVEKGRLHSFPSSPASQERPFVAALLQTAGLKGANMDVLRAPSRHRRLVLWTGNAACSVCGPAVPGVLGVGLAWRSRLRRCSLAWACCVPWVGPDEGSGNLNRQIPLNEAQSSTTGPRPPLQFHPRLSLAPTRPLSTPT